MTFPEGWTRGSHAHDGVTHPTYRRGAGTDVIVIPEVPGITPPVAAFAEEVGRGHATVTGHRRREAVVAVLSFLTDTLQLRAVL